MLLGRDFRPQDEPAVTPRDNFMASIGRAGSGGSNEPPEHAARVCVINESLARKLFGGANPLGRHLSYDDTYSAEAAVEVIGVVKDVHHWNVRRTDDIGIMYTPAWGDGAEARWLAVRVAGDPAPVIAAVRRELLAMDPNVPILETRTIEEYVNGTMSRERLIAYLSTFFALLALGLASVGLYGVMSYAVTRRTREVGIRMALGAARGDIIRMVLRESAASVLIGAAAGAGVALALSRLVASLLYGVAPRDPASVAVAAATILIVALAAAAIPARKASRVEPLNALRHE